MRPTLRPAHVAPDPIRGHDGLRGTAGVPDPVRGARGPAR